MQQTDAPKISQSIAAKLGWPILIGSALTVLFYGAIHFGVIPQHSLLRYVTAHPVEYAEVGMFMVGVAALLLKAGQLVGEFRSLSHVDLPPQENGRSKIEHAPALLECLYQLPESLHPTLLFQRLSKGLRHVHASQTAAGLQDEMKYLADIDQERCEHDYSMVRIVIWATPMLGFLGTVIGITLALGNLSPEALVNEPKVAMESLLQGLSVAFDTTALALTLSIGLMFAQFVVGRIESEILSSVDQLAADELTARFETEGSATDPSVLAVKKMAERTIQTTQDLVVRQTELWRDTVSTAHQHWQRLLTTSTDQMETALHNALSESLKTHAEALASAQQHSMQRSSEQLNGVVDALYQVSSSIHAQHEQMTEQGTILLKVVEATGEVASLEDSLNRNLASLAGKQHFEETVQSLAATIHLLNSRMSGTGHNAVQLDRKDKGQAA
ncbi:MotA/TolQ/ExbB proton channel family protein [Bremerella sp. JC817]|uniref:MotA/TolQ/ExbB proton channel family protein n=1 Tax=Bremerella sp. JC817 TaxID=3231756 RepID=UPI003459713B